MICILSIKKQLRKYLDEIKWFIKFKKKIGEAKKIKNNYYVFVGTPEHRNLGDHAIAIATYKLLEDINSPKDILEIPGTMLRTQRHVQKFNKVIKDKTIILNGGGYLGSLWIKEEKMTRLIITNYTNNKIIILPQTMYFEQSEYGESVKRDSIKIYDNHPNLWICLREEQSYELAKKILHHVHLILMPDMVTYLKYDFIRKDRRGIFLCLRSDRERILDKKDCNYINKILNKYAKHQEILYTDTVVKHRIKKETRKQEVFKKIEEFSRSKLVITDRLHGMVFAAIACTPCIALGNCNYKIKGVYNWIENNDYVVFVDDIEQIEGYIKKLMNMENIHYDNRPILEKYEELKRLIAEEI